MIVYHEVSSPETLGQREKTKAVEYTALMTLRGHQRATFLSRQFS